MKIILLITIPLLLFCSVFLLINTNGFNLDDKSFRVNFSDIETRNLKLFVPYICISVFVLTIVYAVFYFVRKILPAKAALKSKKKYLIYFKFIREAGTSDKISLPVLPPKSIDLGREKSLKLKDENVLCLHLTFSGLMIRITRGEEDIFVF